MSIAIILLVLQVGAWPSAPKIEVTLASERDLSSYSTYTWNKSQKALENLANHLRFVNAVQKEMKNAGYRIDTVKPEVLVQYRVEKTKTVETRATQQPSVWDPTDLEVQIEVSPEEQVSVTVELVEAETNFLLWRAKGTYNLGPPDRAERQIQATIAELFSKYPGKEDKKKK